MIACFYKRIPKLLALLLVFFSLGSLQKAYAQDVDCSVSANCTDAYCNYPATTEKGCNCFDGVDNDSDGKVDKADSNCATYYGLVFVGDGSDCSITPPGANTPFDLVDAPITSAQNTADTQSKVSVGDVDGDGIPDAVITSKWNSEIRVVATAGGQADGTAAGKVKSDFNLSGAAANALFSEAPNSGICKPGKLLFEHENLIADIDGDGKAELFGIVSNRGGNPSTPPTCFFLVGFKYAPADLVALFKAVPIGGDRPGTFGIADMDGDGKAEIYLRDRIYAAETGKLLATSDGTTSTANWDVDVTSAPVAVNITGDNKLELVCGNRIFSIPTLTNRTPASPAALTLVKNMNDITTNDFFVKLMNDPVEYGVDTHSSCSVADIDGDGNLDIVISGALNSTSGKTAIFYWNVAKDISSYYLPVDPNNTNGWPWGTGRVNLIDSDDDNHLDMFFIAGNQLYRIETDATGEKFAATVNSAQTGVIQKTINDSRSGVVSVTLYDFDNDGNIELVYRDSQELAVVDSETMSVKQWSATCQSHTYTEGPVIADVNGDGATDVCVSCNTSNSFDITDPIQQQALGQFRLYYSSGNEWLPTRMVWNQPGYFVVNINDDLTLPFPQLDQVLVFGTGSCPNGTQGPQQPLNVFMDQVPYLSANGCPTFPAPDLAFEGDDPDSVGFDSNGDGVYQPAVEIVPPVCGDLPIEIRFNIANVGDLPITDSIPVSFFKGDPTVAGATLIEVRYIQLTNLQVDDVFTTDWMTLTSDGTSFQLYVVLNNDGSVLPINLSGSSSTECTIVNNMYDALVDPFKFEIRTLRTKPNESCSDSPPYNGALEVQVWKNGAQIMDLSPYEFEWFAGDSTSGVLIPGEISSTIDSLQEGLYSVRGTNTLKGCQSSMVQDSVTRLGFEFTAAIDTIQSQTKCSPADGILQVLTSKPGSFTYQWLDSEGNATLGVTTSTITGLPAGKYSVRVMADSCVQTPSAVLPGPDPPVGQASTLQNVEDCSNPNSGRITATALVTGIPADTAGYNFTWYYYNAATLTRGSILPAAHGDGATRRNLPVGTYEVIITDKATNCSTSGAPAITATITSATVLPSVTLEQVAPQTACDPALANGSLRAIASGTGLTNPDDFTFEWFLGQNTLPANAVTTVTGAKGDTLVNGLGGGLYYTIKVTTAFNCSATADTLIEEVLTKPVVTLDSVNNSICDPALATTTYNGQAIASVNFDGVAVADFTDYTFSWTQGSLTTDPPLAQTTPTVIELQGGNYTLVVERTDLGCVADPVTVEVLNAEVLPVITTSSVPSTNCVGGITDGEVTVTSVTPNIAHTYRWFDPSNVVIAGQTSSSLTGLQGGAAFNYGVEVTYTATGCVNTFSTNVADIKQSPVITLTSTENSMCAPATAYNGTASMLSLTDTNAEGTDTYSYVWSTGSDMTAPIGGATSASITGKNGGFYTATTTNSRTNCTSAPVTVEIENDQILPVLSATPVAATNCNTDHNGEMTMTVTNPGADTYSFIWRKGNLISDPSVTATSATGTSSTIEGQEGAQNYFAQATNNTTGCTNTLVQTIPDNSLAPVLVLEMTPNEACAAGLFTGTVSVTSVTGANELGTDTYTYAWSVGNDMSTGFGGTTDSETGLDGGFYTATATNDRLGCTSDPVTIQVTETIVLPDLSATQTPSTNCNTDHNGEVDLVVNTPGAHVYTYVWTKGNTIADPAVPNADITSTNNTSSITGQQGGQNYFVQVTNTTTGCVNSLVQTITDGRVAPVLALAMTENEACVAGLFTGTVSATSVTGPNELGTDTYTYAWSIGNDMTTLFGGTTDTETGLDGGFYTGTATNDRLGCTSTPVTIQVTETIVLPNLSATQTPSTNCNTDHNGEVDVVVNTPGAHIYTFVWRKGSDMSGAAIAGADITSTDNTTSVANQQGGQNYFVQATNTTTGCVNSLVQTITDARVLPVLALQMTENEACVAGLFTGTVSATSVTGANELGTDTYTYAWSTGNDMTTLFGGTTDTETGLDGGFYTATATNDRLGCTSNPVTIQVTETIVLPDLSATQSPSTNCNADHNGEIDVVVNSPGAHNYTFEWRKGADISGAAIAGADITSTINTTSVANQEGGQNYFVQATNVTTGCVNSLVQTITDGRVVPVLTLQMTPNEGCAAGLFTGTASSASVTGPNEDVGDTYTYAWSTGNDMSAPLAGTTDSQIDLDGGFYTATVTNDRLGCTSNPVTIQVTEVIVLPDIAATQTPSTNCNADHNGEIDAIINSPGAHTYNFVWRIGTQLTDPAVTADSITTVSASASSVRGQQGGLSYFIQATNTTTGCVNTFVQAITDNRILPVLTLDSIPNEG
ncbi:MAG TPA: hypothetical protein VD927_08220, partial [Chryseosolibacter sp.]|nr:hypothetical protein [Chryseosolibacter sp.]